MPIAERRHRVALIQLHAQAHFSALSGASVQVHGSDTNLASGKVGVRVHGPRDAVYGGALQGRCAGHVCVGRRGRDNIKMAEGQRV